MTEIPKDVQEKINHHARRITGCRMMSDKDFEYETKTALEMVYFMALKKGNENA